MDNFSKELLASKIKEFLIYEMPRRQNLGDYYHGKNKIIKGKIVNGRPNNQLRVNLARYISDVQTGYFMGTCATLEFNDGVTSEVMARLCKMSSLSTLMYRLARSMSIFGVGYAMVYMSENGTKAQVLDSAKTFFIHSDHISPQALGAVRILKITAHEVCGELYTRGFVQQFVYSDTNITLSVKKSLGFSHLPIVEFKNNDDMTADFEPALSLLDAYNVLLSGAMDDMQSVANAFLALYGMQGTTKEDIEQANSSRVLSLSENGRAEFVVKNVNSDALEFLKRTLLDGILLVTMTPDLTDETFGKAQSGIAIEYKLWGIEQARAEKQRNFDGALTHFAGLMGAMHGLDFEGILLGCNVKFYKNLPQDAMRVCENVAALGDVVSHRTKLELLPFVEDAKRELERIEDERKNDNESKKN